MSIRDNLDISAYLVLGPENTLGRPVGDVRSEEHTSELQSPC